MPLNATEKAAVVATLKENFDKAVATILVNYSGVTVGECC